MRKNKKLVAVLSTAALLALGTSMTSFAATGWQESNGEWSYYSNDESKATDMWKKSGENWFYLNEDGNMVRSSLVEKDDNIYYVNEDGVMITNQWVSIDSNDDFYDDDSDEDTPDKYWYYFGTNGKAYNSTSGKTTLKTINDKKYAFDEDGKMLYGWVKDGERQTETDGWKDSEYYFGTENDGAMTTGWAQILVTDEDWDDEDDTYDEDQERWFYFKTNGKKVVNDDDYSVNGKKYAFDEDGRMLYEWVTKSTASDSNATPGNADYSSSFRYFSSPENGARVSKGWFKVIPDEQLNADDYDDDEESWYYADGKGHLVAGEIKSINGKKYAFDTYGRMLEGLTFVELEDNKTITEVYDDEDYDDEDEFDAFVENHPTAVCYYFGSEDDGEMKTGTQTVNLDGDDFKFFFNKSGSKKGQGKVGYDDKKIYKAGKIMKADSDEKYKIVAVTTENDVVNVDYIDVSDFISGGEYNESKKRTEYEVLENSDTTTYYLVNQSGGVQTSSSGTKDGDDYYFTVKNKVITGVYVKD